MMRRRHLLAGYFAITLLAAAPAATGEDAAPTLDRGRQQYEDAEFEAATATFGALLEAEGTNDTTRVEAHRYLAALELIMEDAAAAREHVAAALALDREAAPPEGAPPELAGMFDEARAALPEEAPEGEGERDESEREREHDGFTDRWVTIGLGAGLYVPTIVNDMLPHVTVGLDVGVQLPFLDRRFSVVVGGAWSPPGNDGESTDPRLGADGEQWTWDMTTHEVFLSLGAVYRILPPGTAVVVPYVGLAARLYLLRTTVTGTGNDGLPLGEHTEVSTHVGGAITVGGEVPLGPGALFFDLAFGISDLPHRITGQTTTSALVVDVGYRLFL